MEKKKILKSVPKWHKVSKCHPTNKTRHARRYGVPVLGFDEDEFKDSGYCTPFDVNYDFKKKWFYQLAHGSEGVVWVEAMITHWIELPEVPKL